MAPSSFSEWVEYQGLQDGNDGGCFALMFVASWVVHRDNGSRHVYMASIARLCWTNGFGAMRAGTW